MTEYAENDRTALLSDAPANKLFYGGNPMKLADTLCSLVDDFNREFTNAAERSRKAHVVQLQPGSVIPGPGKIYGDEERAAFMRKADEISLRAQNAIDLSSKKIRAKMADPPSTDAVNSITMLQMRKHVTEDDLNNLVERYGDNYQTYKALASIALDREMPFFSEHPLDEQEAHLESIKNGLRGLLTLSSAERYGSLDSVCSFMKEDIKLLEVE